MRTKHSDVVVKCAFSRTFQDHLCPVSMTDLIEWIWNRSYLHEFSNHLITSSMKGRHVSFDNCLVNRKHTSRTEVRLALKTILSKRSNEIWQQTVIIYKGRNTCQKCGNQLPFFSLTFRHFPRSVRTPCTLQHAAQKCPDVRSALWSPSFRICPWRSTMLPSASCDVCAHYLHVGRSAGDARWLSISILTWRILARRPRARAGELRLARIAVCTTSGCRCCCSHRRRDVTADGFVGWA